jgi:hypothetical protein
VKTPLNLAHGLRAIGGPHRRMLLLAMAFHANLNGKVWASERRLRNDTELGREWFGIILRELEVAGWIRRDGDEFFLVISKMEANQRFGVNSPEYLAARGYSDGANNQNGCLGTLNRSKEGYL